MKLMVLIPIATAIVKTLVCVLFIITTGYSQGTWIQQNNFPMNARIGGVSFAINGKGYYGTGHLSLPTNDFWEYDPNNDFWTQKADASPIIREFAIGFELNNKGYIGLGDTYPSSNLLNDIWEYDPTANGWIQKNDFPGFARINGLSCVLNGNALVGLGDSSGIKLNDWWEYEPIGDSWSMKSTYPGINNGCNIFSIGNFCYVIGLDTISYNGFIWQYNLVNDNWIQKSFIQDSSKGRGNAIVFVSGSVAYYGTGKGKIENNSGCFKYKNDLWQYNVISGQWLEVDSLPGPRRDNASSFFINGKGYVFGGYNQCTNPQYLSDVWEYTPDTTVFAGVGNTEKGINISVYPNPFSNRIIVNGIESTGFNCSLFDLKGSKVSVVRSGKSIQTKDVKPGIYLLQINFKEKDYFFKVIKKSKE